MTTGIGGVSGRTEQGGGGFVRCRRCVRTRNRSPPPRMKMVRFPWKLRPDCTWMMVSCLRTPLYDPGGMRTCENPGGRCAGRCPARAIGVNPALDPCFSPNHRGIMSRWPMASQTPLRLCFFSCGHLCALHGALFGVFHAFLHAPVTDVCAVLAVLRFFACSTQNFVT